MTYNGLPLYFFKNDKAPGDANGIYDELGGRQALTDTDSNVETPFRSLPGGRFDSRAYSRPRPPDERPGCYPDIVLSWPVL